MLQRSPIVADLLRRVHYHEEGIFLRVLWLEVAVFYWAFGVYGLADRAYGREYGRISTASICTFSPQAKMPAIIVVRGQTGYSKSADPSFISVYLPKALSGSIISSSDTPTLSFAHHYTAGCQLDDLPARVHSSANH